MNRYDEIKCKARDIASHVHADPEARDAMAYQLIELVGLMLGAVGKAVAVEGETSMNEAGRERFDPGDSDEYTAGQLMDAEDEFKREQHDNEVGGYVRYRTGERMQDAARELIEDAKRADVERYHRVTPGSSCRCGHVRSVHVAEGCTGETFNHEACKDGPCTGYVAYGGEPVWTHEDRRPMMFRHMDERGVLYLPPELANAQREYDAEVTAAAVQRVAEVKEQARAELRRILDDPRVRAAETVPLPTGEQPGKCGRCGYQARREDGSCSRCGAPSDGFLPGVKLTAMPFELFPESVWITRDGRSCNCVPVAVTNGRGETTGWDLHPAGCRPYTPCQPGSARCGLPTPAVCPQHG